MYNLMHELVKFLKLSSSKKYGVSMRVGVAVFQRRYFENRKIYLSLKVQK